MADPKNNKFKVEDIKAYYGEFITRPTYQEIMDGGNEDAFYKYVAFQVDKEALSDEEKSLVSSALESLGKKFEVDPPPVKEREKKVIESMKPNIGRYSDLYKGDITQEQENRIVAQTKKELREENYLELLKKRDKSSIEKIIVAYRDAIRKEADVEWKRWLKEGDNVKLTKDEKEK